MEVVSYSAFPVPGKQPRTKPIEGVFCFALIKTCPIHDQLLYVYTDSIFSVPGILYSPYPEYYILRTRNILSMIDSGCECAQKPSLHDLIIVSLVDYPVFNSHLFRIFTQTTV